ncbi:MAG: FtsX-like permease family protein [Spirochaetales bacterium]|nr:FtsX-like permease family protein [Spirochaetales bacterium]
MGTIFKIAWRNLKEHKTKTLIIGTLITLGSAILLVGNSLIDTAAGGLKANYTENYTGDIMIAVKMDYPPNILGMSPEIRENGISKVPEIGKIEKYLDERGDIAARTGVAAGFAQVSFAEEGRGFSMLFGIDPDHYLTMFPGNIRILEGSMLTSGQEGLVLNRNSLKMLEESSGEKLHAGDLITLTGSTANSGITIREVALTGIFEFVNSNLTLQYVSLIDIQTMRSLQGLTLYGQAKLDLSAEESESLGSVNEEDIFADFGFKIVETGTGIKNENDLADILGDLSNRDMYSLTKSDAWHYLLLKLEQPGRAAGVIRDINRYFTKQEIDAKAYDWISAAGPAAKAVSGLKTIFNAIIIIIAVVALIIIMNTLVISVTERIPEIGTMRAIGARKGFIRKMISMETLLLSIAAGTTGIVAGSAILLILQATGIPAGNMFLEVLFGGQILYPLISGSSVVLTILSVSLIGVLASLYPTAVALKISPVTAMQS